MARSFDDGSSQYIQVASAPISAPPFTVACWFYRATGGGGGPYVLLDLYNQAYHYYRLSTDWQAYLYFEVDGSGGEDTATYATASHSYDTWHHACAVASSTTSRAVYLDGANKQGGNDTALTVLAPGSTTIGATGAPTEYMEGMIAHVAIWSAALSDDEVAALGAGADPRMIQASSLVAYYPLIRTDQDIVGGADMTAYNSPTWGVQPGRVYGVAPVLAVSPGAVGGGQTATPSGIASTLALGTVGIVKTRSVSGIASGEAFGTATIAKAYDIVSGIASTVAIGTPSFVKSVAASGIASGLALGTATIRKVISVSGIASGAALGAASFYKTVMANGIGSTLRVGTASILGQVLEQARKKIFPSRRWRRF